MTRAFVHTYADDARQHPKLILAASLSQYALSPLAERIRQVGYYVDFHAQEKRWILPAEVTKHDVELWLNRLEPSLARVQGMADLGLFSTKALKIQREVLGPVNIDRPKRKNLSEDDVKKIQMNTLAAHKDYYRRLVADGILPVDADLEVMGKPLNEFIAE